MSAVIRTIAFVVPLLLSTAFAMAASAALPPASSRVAQIADWVITAFASTGVLMLADHAARRLLPLAALMNLSIVFPDQAPSRYKIARSAAGVRTLEARLERARQLGAEDEPTRAAALILELVTALQRHDRRTRGHSERVHLFTEMLAKELDLPDEDRDRLRWAALVHDVGKLTVPEEVLNKADKPDDSEWQLLRRHPVEGARLCEALRPWMGRWWLAIEQHHEHYDGSGYPHGLAGKNISLGARIVSVADSFEVMTAARSYKSAGSAAAGREELARCAGTQFDPDIVRSFLTISLGRMRLALGPLAWFAQFPMVEGVVRAGGLVRLLGGLVATATTAILVGAPTLATETPPASPAALAAPAGRATATEGTSEPAPLPLVPQFTPTGEDGPTTTGDDDVAVASPPGPSATLLEPLPPLGAAPPAPPPAGQPVQPAVPGPVPSPGQPTNPGPPPAGQPTPSPPPPTPSPAPTPTPTPTPTPSPSPAPTPTPVPIPAPAAPVALADAATVDEDTDVVIDVLANDTDANGDTLTITTVTDGARGRTAVTGGMVTYTPDPDSNGVDTFTYAVGDSTGRTDTASVTVTVTPVNDPPIAGDDTATTAEDTPTTIDVLANDTDPDAGDTLTIQSFDATGITDGTLIALGGGQFRFTPDLDYTGTQTFTYIARDPAGATTTATATITVTPVNDPPTAGDDTATTAEDTPTTIDVLANDTDPDAGDTLTIQSFDATGITDGTLVDLGNGQFQFTPDPDYTGTQTFTYVARDLAGATATATATITVTPVNDPPIAGDDIYIVQRGVPLTVPAPGVLANDGDVDDDTLEVTMHSQPFTLGGTVTVDADGSLTYTPPLAGIAITDTFTYDISDGVGGTDTATVTFDVRATPPPSSTFYLGTSGSDADTFALVDTAPPAGDPEPDHDGDGEDGLTIDKSDGKIGENDPDRYQHWTRTFNAATTYEGQVRLALWSTVADFKEDKKGHYHIYVHDCADDGSDCNLLIETENHIDEWNGGVANWVFKDLPLGTLDHTFARDRMLRVRLMFKHEAMWVAMSQDRPTRLILNSP